MNNPEKTPIEVTGKKPICISFSSEVSAKTSVALMGAMAAAVNDGFDEIHFFLSTPGGTVHEGIAIYNTIRSLPVPVRSYNLGNVNSIGNVLFQAGEKRICAKNSSFMFHGVGIDVEKARFELKQLNETVSSVRNDQSLIASIMVRHTKLTEEEIEGLFLAMAHMNALDAVERGIADEVRDIHLPKGVPISQLIFQCESVAR